MNKKGQYYLVAAIILAGIALSIATIANYAKKQSTTDLTNLREEIQIEGARTLDYCLNNNFDFSSTNSIFQDLASRYIAKDSRDTDLYFLFGTEDNMTLKGYQKSAHDVSLDNTQVTSSKGVFVGSVNPKTNMTVTIDNNVYVFNLKTGENFYFLLAREQGEGQYIIQG